MSQIEVEIRSPHHCKHHSCKHGHHVHVPPQPQPPQCQALQDNAIMRHMIAELQAQVAQLETALVKGRHKLCVFRDAIKQVHVISVVGCDHE